ncbi:MAG TPA: hypothetical protein VFE61_30185 [Candidatus Sulfotelmatobacter sp.]|nr:hypothetical protein [Candidatus Sulfotelmatobacter sp.]
MPIEALTPHLRSGLLVTSLKALTRSILFSMGLDHVLIDFLANAAVGAGTVLLLIFAVGLGIPRRAPVTIRRTTR